MAVKLNLNDKKIEDVINRTEFYLTKAWDGEISEIISMTGCESSKESFPFIVDIFVSQFNEYITKISPSLKIVSVVKTEEKNEIKFIFSNKDYCYIEY